MRFSPDGKFALVNSMHNFADGRGTVTSVRLNDSKDAKGQPVHVIASRVEAGQQPEGLAVSPDGRWVATANPKTSYLPLADPVQKSYGSVSLLRMGTKLGVLTRVGEFSFDGMLPEPIIFDNSSHFLAVGNFGQFEDPKGGGAIEFFRITEDSPSRESGIGSPEGFCAAEARTRVHGDCSLTLIIVRKRREGRF